MTPAVTSHHNADGLLRVYVGGTLHLAFSTEKLASIQSWSRSHTRSPAMYAIEVTPTEGAPTLCEYDREDLWRDVLGAIDLAFGAAPGQTDGRRGL